MSEWGYSTDALLNRAPFYADYNDITIYVEDVDREFEYEEIFRKIVGSALRITAIIPAGGKTNLIDIFNENMHNLKLNKTFYLADGDFDRIIKAESMIDNAHFVYLNAYNIENYFLESAALRKYAKGKLRCQSKDLESLYDYEKWKTTIVPQAKALFVLYCYLQKYYPEDKNVSRNPYEFIDQKTGFFRESSYERFYQQLASRDPELNNRIISIEQKCDEVYEDPFFFVCGKFLFTSMFCYLESRGMGVLKKEELRWFLVCQCSFRSLEYLKQAIIASVQ